MYNKNAKKILILTLVFLYIPFIYDYGVRYIRIQNVDLPSFYWAANVVFNDHDSPYRPGIFTNAQQILNQRVFPYLYPPPSLLLFFPFSLMSYETTKIMVLLANHVSILILISFVLYNLSIRQNMKSIEASFLENGTMILFIILYIFHFYPIELTLNHGQINFYVLILLCLGWYAIKKDLSSIAISIPFTLSIILKTYPLLFILVLLAKKQYRTIAWTVFFLLVFSVASYIILPRSTWIDWFSLVLPSGGYGETPTGLFSPAEPMNQSVNGFTSRLFLHEESSILPSPLAAKFVPYLLSIGIIIVELLLSWRLWTRYKNKFIDFEFALFLLTMYLIAPLSWEHHLVFVLPAILLAIWYLFSFEQNFLMFFFVGLCAFLLAWHLPFYSSRFSKGLLQLAISVKFYAVFGLWSFFVILLARCLKDGVTEQRSPLNII